MAIFGVIAAILAIIFPIGIIALIVYLIVRKNSNNGEKKDDFEKVIRTVYTYILVLAFLIASVASFISAVDTMADYLLPEEEYSRYDEDYDYDYDYRRTVLNKQNDRNEMAINMITNFAIVVICVPMFVYHMNLTKSLIKKEK